MSDNQLQRIVTVVDSAVKRAGIEPGDRIDPIAVILANGADIYYGPYDPETSLGAFLEGAVCDIVTLSEKLKSDPFARRHAALHELSHLLLKQSGITTDAVSCYMPGHLARATNEILAVDLHAMLAIRNSQLAIFLDRFTCGDGMDLANFCDTTFDMALRRLITAPAATFGEEPLPDAVRLAAVLERTRSRVEIIGREDLSDYVRRDPKAVSDPLFESEAMRTLKTIEILASLDGGSGEAVAAIIAKEPAIDLRNHFEQLPLAVAKAVLHAINQLPVSQAAIASGIFFTKLGHFSRAIDAVTDVPWATPGDKANGLCVQARCIKLADEDGRGENRAAETYRRALTVDPLCNEARAGLVKYDIRRRDFNSAQRHLKKIGDFRRYYYTGKFLAAQGRTGEAIGFYKLSVSMTAHAYWKKSMICLAQLYAKDGFDAEARRTYADLLDAYPYDVQALQQLIDLLITQGNPQEAVEQILGLTHSPGFQPWCLTTLAKLFDKADHGSFARHLSFQAAILKHLRRNKRRSE